MQWMRIADRLENASLFVFLFAAGSVLALFFQHGWYSHPIFATRKSLPAA
jgi:hypothetical protein